jgi:hypothetical protein
MDLNFLQKENLMKKYFSKLILISLLFSFLTNVLTAERKKAEDVFEKWTKIQQVFENTNISELKSNLKDENFISLKSHYISALNFLQTFASFFELLPAEQLEKGFFKLSAPDDKLLKQRFENLYDMLQGDVSKFVDYLKMSYLTTKSPGVNEAKVNKGTFIEESKSLMMSLFFSKDLVEVEKHLFNIGNKFFEYCFNIKTWPNFKSMLLDETQHVVAKFLYSVMWWNLAGNGWKHWSAQTLKNLKQKANDGCEIIYIAGGSDIYQLIKHGIYNIKIIDPLLPSQPKYYSEGRDWLITRSTPAEGLRSQLRHVGATASATAAGFDGQAGRTEEEYGIGDEIEFDFDSIQKKLAENSLVPSANRPVQNSSKSVTSKVEGGQSGLKKIIMRRESFKPSGQKFQARIATGQMIDIERSETVWGIYDPSIRQSSKILTDGKNTPSVHPDPSTCSGCADVSKGLGKRLGSFKIERRFVNQNDFTNDKKKAMLISFNELYFIATPSAKGGWGINPYKFSDNMYINVKQLHKPVSSKVVRNMRSALEQMEFNYIALGTCVD